MNSMNTTKKAAKPKLNRKKQNQIRMWLRFAIQLVFFLFMPSAFTAAFSGVKYLFTQIGAKQPLEMTSFLSILLVLLLYTIVFGRFFCGFACAFGSFGDWVRSIYLFICKKRKKKPIRMSDQLARVLSYMKYVSLALIVILCYAGIYSGIKGWSPWEVFSMIHAGNFKLGGYAMGIAILIIIIAGMCMEERFFCRFLCPMGAVFSLMPVLPFFSLHRDRENCIKKCSACTRTCPSGIGLPNEDSVGIRGDCFQCQKCIGVCPKQHIHCGASRKLKGNEIWFTLLRAGILLILFLILGV